MKIEDLKPSFNSVVSDLNNDSDIIKLIDGLLGLFLEEQRG